MTVEHTKRPLIDGQRIDTAEDIEVTDLADDGTLTRVGVASTEQAEQALAAAHNVKRSMAKTTIPERVAWLSAIAEGIEDRKADFAKTIVREAGKPISSARSEVDDAAERFRRAVEEARTLDGEYRKGTTDSHEGWTAMTRPEPIGTVLCITPYNYPLSTPALHIAPALAAGNSVILKAATQTPVSAGILADIIHETDIPDGGFNYVPGQGSEIGDVLVGDDRINAITMTGSAGAGDHVARESGLVEYHLELGGNAPAIVFPDADLDNAAAACTSGSLKYAGQRCSAVSRVLAHETIHDELVERIDNEMDNWDIADLFDTDTDLGPLIDEEQAEWVEELVNDAVDHGATLIRGGERDGRYYTPTLLADVPPEARIIHEEQFGPVIPVTTITDRDNAIALANESDLALDGSVFTADHDRALYVAECLDAGAVRINGEPSHGIGDIPFGGKKASGIGREGIGVSIEMLLQRKSIIL
jgi:glyceraldehyde-3-phosphate dehydrogenase [NAD(P)+]